MRALERLMAALAIVAMPAAAQNIPAVTLVPGEAVIIPIGASGMAGAPERRRAEWTAFDVYAARHLSGITPPDAPETIGRPLTAGPGEPKPEPIPQGLVRLRFMSIAGRHTMLVVENGLDRPIAYSALMTTNGQARPTDVCLVLANFPSYEHWPHPIEQIELTNFHHVDSPPGQMPTCK